MLEAAGLLNAPLFEQLYVALERDFLGNFSSNGQLLPQYDFQFPNPNQVPSAVWVQLTENFQAYQMFNAGDLAPISKTGWMQTGPMSPSVWANYGYWLNAVVPPGGEGVPAFTTAQARPLPDGDASPDPASPEFTARLGALGQAVASTNPQLAAAIAAYTNPLFRTIYAGVGSPFVAGRTFVGSADRSEDPVQDWTAWSTGEPNPDLNPYSTRIQLGNSTSATLGASDAALATEPFFLPLALSAGDRAAFVRDVTGDASSSLLLRFASLFLYPISRPGWFEPAFLQNSAGWNLQPGNTIDFFGATAGTLYLIPANIFLGWNPSLVLTITTKLYEKWKPQLMSAQGIVVGGITIGVGIVPTVLSSSSRLTVLQFGDPTAAESLAQVPLIVGWVHLRTT